MKQGTDIEALIQESLRTIGKVLGTPNTVLGIGWVKQNSKFRLLGALGEYFARPDVQHALKLYLPKVSKEEEGSRVIPARRLGLKHKYTTLLISSKPVGISQPSFAMSGLLVALPRGTEIPDDHWDTLNAVTSLMTTALYGLNALRESDRQQARLRATARVGREATTLLEPDKLLDQVAEFISDEFGFYHVGIFLVDEDGDYAVLQASNSTHGHQMINKGHRQKIGSRGMVGYVTATGKARIAMNVDPDTQYFSNPFLPNSRSEITLPMRYGEQIIGAIDVQSTEDGAFNQDDFNTLQIMADQLANLLFNARLHEEVWQRLDETRLLQQIMVQGSALKREDVFERALNILKANRPFAYHAFFERQQASLIASKGSHWPQNQLPLSGTPWEKVWNGERFWRTKRTDLSWAGRGINTLAAIPIQDKGTTLAILAVANPEKKRIEVRELHFLSALAANMSVLLQNVQYYETITRNAALLQRLLQAAEHMIAAHEVPAILDILTETLLNEMRGTVEVGLLSEDGNNIRWVKQEGTPGLNTPNFVAHLLGHTSSPLLQKYLEYQRLITPKQHKFLKAEFPEIRDIIERLPQRPILIQPLQTTERIVGLLLISTEATDSIPLEEWVAWVQVVANQAALTLDNAQLLDKLRRQATEIRRAYDEARHLNDIRTQMIQNVSHELRTPLGLIMGYTEMLSDGAVGKLSPEQERIIKVINTRSESLNRMIQDLTSMQGKIYLENIVPVALPNLITQVIEEYVPIAERGGVELQVDQTVACPSVPGDPERLKLAISHLVENAIKFSSENSTVLVKSWVEGGDSSKDIPDDKWFIVQVSDQGIGIAEEHLGHIFERFYQVDGSTTRRYGGMGIGLALVWDIVEAHGGSIQVDSKEGKGSTFTVFLPYDSSRIPTNKLIIEEENT